MTKSEIDALSTPQERWAEVEYDRLQREAMKHGTMGETALLEASQVIGILVTRNKRLKLTKRRER